VGWHFATFGFDMPIRSILLDVEPSFLMLFQVSGLQKSGLSLTFVVPKLPLVLTF
jgi:hypothetical protein